MLNKILFAMYKKIRVSSKLVFIKLRIYVSLQMILVKVSSFVESCKHPSFLGNA